jgi:hypothetical protein
LPTDEAGFLLPESACRVPERHGEDRAKIFVFDLYDRLLRKLPREEARTDHFTGNAMCFAPDGRYVAAPSADEIRPVKGASGHIEIEDWH